MDVRKRTIVLSVGLAVIVLVGGCFVWYWLATSQKAHHQKLIEEYMNIQKRELAWLAASQLPDGSLPFRPQDNDEAYLNPYFSITAARALLSEENNYGLVANYITWHIEHLNMEGEDAGTIYDYYVMVEDGQETQEWTDEDFDSVDSYAARFLCLLWEYWEATGDTVLLLEYAPQWKTVLQAMERCMDSSGLTLAKPGGKVRYLMDNCEVYAGLDAAVNLFETVLLPNIDGVEGKQTEALIDRLHAQRDFLKTSIETHLWNETEQRYETGLLSEGLIEFDGWDVFYPDAVAQLYPASHGLINVKEERAQSLYRQFCTQYRWEDMEHLDDGSVDFYWGILVYTAAVMNDEPRVLQYLDEYARRVGENHAYPVYNADAGWVALACEHMIRYHEDRIGRLDPLGILG